MKTPSGVPPPPLPTHAQPPTQAPHPSVLERKLNASFTKKERKKKPQGATSQRKKPASFIKSPTFIKTSCSAGRYQPSPIPPAPQNLQLALLGTSPQPGVRFPPGLPSSENAVRSVIQREAPASLHPPSAPVFLPTVPKPLF